MADPTDTTPGASGRAPYPTLPAFLLFTVEALGREHRRLEALALDICERREEAERTLAGPTQRVPATITLQALEMLAYDRARAFQDLALTLPAQSWADALVHLTLAMDVTETLDDDDLSTETRKDVLVQLRRAHASIFPRVAEAAGPAANGLVEVWHVARHAFEFGQTEGSP